ncbi:stage II sporulation protein M [Caldicellulosiruptor morganii]|uniref:Stage II sporulation protein M n=1 Tax=Caldicellulosiruptor morganii TaxID=1387555 RepID=A0ABY7BPY9_9FIRM|nr:stage II sporulation protein M [Caldicellulosiruptor morganii]WAM33840.1 stage II sporulation protein M [Caldicellulosiruptor morganii]
MGLGFLVDTLKKEKRLILICLLIFLLFLTLGIVTGAYFSDLLEKLTDTYLKKMFGEILKNANSKFDLFLAILKNNMKVYIIVLVAGTLTFGLVSLFVLMTNGAVVGAVAALSAKKTSIAKTLLLLLPHGVIEIFAFLIGTAASAIFLENLINEKQRENTKVLLKRFLALSLLGAILIVIAAFIEAYVTLSFAA